MEIVLKDLRHAVRSLARRPAWTVVAALSLALGIGANTTVFTLVKALLLKPLPVTEPASLMAVFTHDAGHPDRAGMGLSYPNLVDVAEQSKTLSVVVHTFSVFDLMLGGEPRRTLGQFVSGNYFDVVGVGAALGRTLNESDVSAPGAGEPMAVLSHGFWLRSLGGDPAVVGSVINVANEPYTVVGVMPPGFTGDQPRIEPDMWLPLSLLTRITPGYTPDGQTFISRRGIFFSGLARLAPGVSQAEAQAELDLISRRLEEQYPEANKGRSFRLMPLAEANLNPDPEARARQRMAMALLMGLVGLVLLIACANVANLLLARATARAKEVAVRVSLGSTRAHLVRRFLAESLLLALAGGVLGLAVAWWGRQLLLSAWPAQFVSLGYDLSLDGRVLGFTFVLTLAAGIVFGLVPAWKASRTDVVSELKDLPARNGGRRLSGGNLLVVGQVALSLVALIATGLFVRSLDALRDVDPRFEAGKLAMVAFEVGAAGYRREQAEVFFDEITERAAHLPGVESATVSGFVPFGLGGFFRTVYLPGQDEGGEGGRLVLCGAVGPGYFETLGIPLLSGRGFRRTDTADSRKVVVVNQAMAGLFWPGADPVGQRFHFHGLAEDRFVVGVARDSRVFDLQEDIRPLAYYPLAQNWGTDVGLVVRTAGDPSTVLPGLRQALTDLDPNLPYRDLSTMTAAIEQTLFGPRTVARMVGVFGAVALALSLLGLFSVVSYSVARRRREIGLRMALGARRRDVLGLVLAQGLALVGSGLAVGLLASWAGGRLVERFLFGIRPTDLATFVAVPLMLVLAAVAALVVPARRAATIDPVVALKYE